MAEHGAAAEENGAAAAEDGKKQIDPYNQAKSKEDCCFAHHLGSVIHKDDADESAGNNFQRCGLSSVEAAARLETERKKVTLWERLWERRYQVGKSFIFGTLVFVAIYSAVQAVDYFLKGDTQVVITDRIQEVVGLIVLVIT